MKWLIPAIIVGLVGGLLDAYTELHKVWCFLIGLGAFMVYLLIKSVYITAILMKETKGAKKVWIDQNNKVVKKR